MPFALRPRPVHGVVGTLLIALAALLAARFGATEPVQLAALLLGVLALAGVCYLLWQAEPRYTFTAAIVLAPFAGNWQQIHVPGELAPERLVLAIGILAVLLRGPGIRDRPRLRFEWVHWVMLITIVYAMVSAFFSGTLLQKSPGIALVETFGMLPFLTFTLAPVVFPTARERATLLTGLVALGTYLSVTTLLEFTGPKALVFPSYILNPAYGYQYGYGRGPFAEAVANGFGLYACALACFIAVGIWSRRGWRIFAAAVGVLCLVGTLLTLERSVWISTVAASLVIVIPATRRIAVPLLLVAALGIGVVLLAVPELGSKVTTRAGDRQTVWDRENLEHTALRMIEARPLLGFGWSRYIEDHSPYLQQSREIPLTATNEIIHNVMLTYGVELGLVGLTLWLASMLMAAVGALLTRGPPDLAPWRVSLLALTVFFFIQESFVPPTVFQSLCLLLWAGVVWAARYPTVAPSTPAVEPAWNSPLEPLTGS